MTVPRFLPVVLIVLASTARADTYGLPPATEFEQEWRADETALVGSAVVAARTASEWSAFWKKHDAKTAAPAVDFEKQMVVGLVRGASDRPLAVYRVELDDAGAPKEPVVRATIHDSLCQKPTSRTLKASRVHLVSVPRSALPVRFVEDIMVDGRVFRMAGGVDERPLGSLAGIPRAESKWPKAGFREEAEHEVWLALGAEGIEAAKKKLWPGVHGARYPQLWSVIDVRRKGDFWEIVYDDARFKVDVESGKVSRP